MEFPIYFLLIIYAIFLFIYSIVALLNIYHVKKYGSVDKRSKWLVLIFLIGVAFILLVTFMILSKLNLDSDLFNLDNNYYNNESFYLP